MDTFEIRRKKYMAVSLVEEDEIKEGVYLYRYTNAEDGDVIVEQIEDEEEYKKAVAAYEKR